MSKPLQGQPDHAEGETYEVRLSGHLDPHWATSLGVASLTRESGGTTTLRAVGLDQAALHGLLQRVRDLGLTLHSVVRIQSASDDSSSTHTNSQRNPK